MQDVWLNNPTHAAGSLNLKFSSELVTPAGDFKAPLLQIVLQVHKPTDNGTQEVRRDQILCHGASLCPEGATYPWSQTGLQPGGEPLFLPITHQQIEAVSQKASEHPEGQIWLYFDARIIVPSELTADRPRDQLPAWLTYRPNSPFLCSIPAPRWYTFLKAWGYPETRLIPISMELPTALSVQNPIAAEAWSVATAALQTANQKWSQGAWMEAGMELRTATEFALQTWCSIWGKDDPAETGDASKAFTFFDQALPQWEPAIGKWPKKTTKETAEIQRVCTRYHLLRQLYTFSHSMHHVGKRPVYTREDVDYLLTSTIALFRTLPSFWTEYPDPLPAPPNPKSRNEEKGVQA